MTDRWMSRLPAFGDLHREFDRLFTEMFGQGSLPTFRGYPPINIFEGADSITVSAAVPGADANRLDVRVEGDHLIIDGEIAPVEAPEGARVLRHERPTGRFHREVPLPKSVSAEGVEATYVNGVLNVVMPKVPEARPQVIKVRAGDSVKEIRNG